MRKLLLMLLAALLSASMMGQPLTGIKTINPTGSGTNNYVSFALAIADLNLNGVGTGGVTFNVASGVTFSESPLTINVTGTSIDPIKFQKSAAVKPVINFTGTSGTTDACFLLNACDYLTFDGLDIRDAGTTVSDYMEYGFNLTGTPLDGCTHNLIQNCVIDLTKANINSRGVNFSSVATKSSSTNSLNKFYNNDVKDCYYGYYLFGNASFHDSENEIGTIDAGTSSISNILMYGAYCGNQDHSLIFNTTISNFTGTGALYGLYFAGTNSTMDIYNNKIHTLTSSAGAVNGILISGAGNLFTIYKNQIFDLSYTGASSMIVAGIQSNAGPASYIYNNFVYDLRNSAGTASPGTRGLSISGGTTVKVYYNSVYLDYVSTVSTNKSAALYTQFTVTSLELRNNIFVNNVTGMAGTKVCAIYKQGSNFANLAATSNNNLYYAGTPGPDNLIFFDGTNSDMTLAAFQTRVAPKESYSVTELPPFMSVVSPYDLHLNTTIKTQCESGGITVSEPIVVIDDFDNNPRFPEAGFPFNPGFNPFAPDLGADEFGGLLLDLSPPVITYTPVLDTVVSPSRTITATFNDPSGVPTTGDGVPQLYYKVNGGAYIRVAGISIGSNKYSFLLEAPVMINDFILYYFVFRDNTLPTANIISSPVDGASGFSYDPPTCDNPPTVPYSYLIKGGISGIFHVGVGKDYDNLSTAVADLNANCMTGPVTFILDDAIYAPIEYEPLTINANPGSSIAHVLTIKPNTGITPTISGTVNQGPLLKVFNSNTVINGSNNGGTSRDLTISNSGVYTTSGIQIGSNGTVPNTRSSLLNTILIQGDKLGNAIDVSNATGGTAGYFNDITIQNNSIQNCAIGIYFNAVATTGNGTGILITGNEMNSAGVNSSVSSGAFIQGVNGATISDNIIGNMDNTTSLSAFGIRVYSSKNSTISGNTITNLVSTFTAPVGINFQSSAPDANVTISGNSISHLSSNSNSVPYGCLIAGSGIMVSDNEIFDIKNTSTNVFISSIGLGIGSNSTSANISVVNNLIHDVTSYGRPSLTDWNGYGINILNGGGYKIYSNTVSLPTNQVASDGNPACLFINSAVTATGSLDIRNNIFSISSSNGTNRYAVLCNASSAVFSAIDNNDYFSTGPNLGYIGSTNRVDLAAWRTGTGMDMNSVSVNPDFVSLTNLLPTTAAMPHAGIHIPSVPNDYTGVNRTNPPDVGAYEFTSNPLITTLAASGITNNVAILNGNANAEGSTFNLFFDYGLTSLYGSVTSTTPGSATGTSLIPMSAGLTGLSGNATYHYRARGVTNDGLTVYGNDMVFTTLPDPPAVITTAATSVTPTGVILNGSVNANSASTTVTFEYGLTTAYGTVLNANPNIVTGATVTLVSTALTGLLPNTTYHFRVIGISIGGTSNGNDMSFITSAIPATVVTNFANAVGSATATLNGTVNANNATTTVSFEWGLTSAYGNTNNATPATVNGMAPASVLTNLTGLAINSTYHFRCVGVNIAGTTYGLDQTFSTNCVDPVITINGPAVACSGTTGILYSTEAGNSSYTWIVSDGGVITAGTGTNSISVTWNTPGAQSVSVNYINPAGCSANTATVHNVTVNPTPSPTITGPAVAGTNYPGYYYSTEAGMNNYVWTITAGGTIVSGQGTNAINVTWNNAGAQNVAVTYSNSYGCAAFSPALLNITVYAAPTISGANVACESSVYLDYTTEPGMSNYIWDMAPNSGTITQSGTNVVTIFWTSPGAKWVSVSYTNQNGFTNPAPTVFNVTVNPLPGIPGVISGPIAVCAGANDIAYSVATVTNANTYTWTLPTGASIATGAGTNAITVNFSQAATSGNVSVSAHNSCGDGPSSPALAVTVNSIPMPAGSISGSDAVCQGSTGITYSVPVITGATSYNWTVSTGITIVSGAGTNAITVNFAATAASGSITVNGVNDCGPGASSPIYDVVVNPLPITPVITQHLDTLTSSAIIGNQWYLDGEMIPGATGNQHVAVYSGNYTVVVTLNGCSSAPSNSLLVLPVSIADVEVNYSCDVYPNPNQGQFNIKVISAVAVELNIEIYNNLGALLWKLDKVSVNGIFITPVDLNTVPDGVYMVSLRNTKTNIIRKVVIRK